jgi:serine/threonine protein phosphatase 1
MKIFAVGDIHGQIYKLRGLIDKLYIDEECLLVFVGDYIDRGDYSFEVIEYLISLSKKYNCVFLKGNHEEMFMDFMSGINEGLFVQNGGYATILSYGDNLYDIHQYTDYLERHLPVEHVDFYQGLKNYYETEDYIFVHAGLLSKDIPLEQQPIDILLWERYDFINSDFDWGKKVIFGHTPNKEVLVMHNKICIDTGSYFEDGCLTCVVLPEEIFIYHHIDAKR